MFLLCTLEVHWYPKDFRKKNFFRTSYGVSMVHLSKLSFQLFKSVENPQTCS